MTNPCEHKNIELLYTTFVSDGIDTVCKCKDCGAELVARGYLTGHINKNGVCYTPKGIKHVSKDCPRDLPDCSICKKED